MQSLKSMAKMPLLELIVPSLRSDATSQKTFRAQWPEWSHTLIDAPGCSQLYYGYMIKENDVNVGSEMKLVISLSMEHLLYQFNGIRLTIIVPEWDGRAEFDHFLTTDDFKTFSAKVKPYALAPSEIQLYESTAEGSTVFTDGITEVFRTKVSTRDTTAEVEKAWAMFYDALRKRSDAKVLHGLSVNLHEQFFVGAVGWDSSEVRRV